MVDLNADVGTIIKGLLGKGGPKKPVAAKGQKPEGMPSPLRSVTLIGIVAVVATAAYVQFFYIPKQRALTEKLSKLEETKKMQGELVQLDGETAKLTKKLEDNREHYAKVIQSFGVNGRIEDLYRAISDIAAVHNLTVVNIRGSDVPAATQGKKSDKDKPAPSPAAESVIEKMVNVELQGKFQQYVAFREKLMQEKPVLSVKSEAIEMGAKGQPGWITIRLVLLDYSIDRNAFEEVLNHGK